MFYIQYMQMESNVLKLTHITAHTHARINGVLQSAVLLNHHNTLTESHKTLKQTQLQAEKGNSQCLSAACRRTKTAEVPNNQSEEHIMFLNNL